MKVKSRNHLSSTRKESRKLFVKSYQRKCCVVGKKDTCTSRHVDWNPSSTTNDTNGRRNYLNDKRIFSCQNTFDKGDDYLARYSYYLQYSRKRSHLRFFNARLSDAKPISLCQNLEGLYSGSYIKFPEFFATDKDSISYTSNMKFHDKTPEKSIESINSKVGTLSILSQVENDWIAVKEFVSTTTRYCDDHTKDYFDDLVAKLAFDSANLTSCSKINDNAKNSFASSISNCPNQLSANLYGNTSSGNQMLMDLCSIFIEYSTKLEFDQTFQTVPLLLFNDLEAQYSNVDPIYIFKYFSYNLDFLRDQTDQTFIFEVVRSFCNIVVHIPQSYTLLNPLIFDLLEVFCHSLTHLSTMYNKCVVSFFFHSILYWTDQLLGMRNKLCVKLKPITVLYLFFSLINSNSEDNESLITLGLSLGVNILTNFIFQNVIEVIYVFLLIDALFRVVSGLKLFAPDILTFLIDFISLYTSSPPSCCIKMPLYERFAKLQIFARVSIVDIPLPERNGAQWIFPTDRIHSDDFMYSVVLYRALFHLSTYLQNNDINSYFSGISPKFLMILIQLQSLEKFPRIFHKCIEASVAILSRTSLCFNYFPLFKTPSKSIEFLMLEKPRKISSIPQPQQLRNTYDREYKTMLKNIRIDNILSSNMLVNDEVLIDRIRLKRVKAIHQHIPIEAP